MTTETARPVKALPFKILHTASNNRVYKVGYQARIVMSDGTDRYCDHHHGHTSAKALTACATKLVRKLNQQAGIDPDWWRK